MKDDWRKSRRSIGDGDCVEAASGGRVRDSEDPGGVVLGVGAQAWAAFIADVKAGAV